VEIEAKPGQFYVYLANPRTDILLDPTTGAIAQEATPVPIFASFEDAVHYAEQAVKRLSEARADIYDHRGRAGDSLKQVYPEALRRRYDPLRRARREFWAGIILLGLFAVWAITFANKSDMHFLWFYILGMKLLVLGLIFVTRGVGYFLGHR